GLRLALVLTAKYSRSHQSSRREVRLAKACQLRRADSGLWPGRSEHSKPQGFRGETLRVHSCPFVGQSGSGAMEATIFSVDPATESGCPTILLQRDWLFCFFDEFFKARVAAQRIPKRHEFQVAIAEGDRAMDDAGKLFAGELFVTDPRSDHRQVLEHRGTLAGIFLDRHQLHRAPAFAQRVLSAPRPGVDQPKHPPGRPVN